ncbi:hypothetical protein G4B88_008358 [Cannabis sativa]|uniref:Membrane-associated kinase regulator 1 n=1 Tax=Cannabis sativa TaxID=3483 RepID=A0A7J6G7Q2_CANSA|nr:hypothetical protein G4B88_008358 [Cannabis sativa]
MGRRTTPTREDDDHHHHNRRHHHPKSQTLPPSPSHSFSSSSSSDFEFTISVSPRKSSTVHCRPADELFYKGQLLPLHLSPRLSMVRTLLLASSSTSSSSDNSTTTASRDSTGSSASNESNSSFNSDLVLLAESCDSSRPSSVTDQDEEFKRLTATTAGSHGCGINNFLHNAVHINKKSSSNSKYFSLARISSVFKKEPKAGGAAVAAAAAVDNNLPGLSGSSSSSVKRMSSSAKEVIRKYMKKVKPLYEKLSQKQGVAAAEENNEHFQPRQQKLGRVMTAPAIKTTSFSTSKSTSTTKFSKPLSSATSSSSNTNNSNSNNKDQNGFSHSFSGNLRYPRRKSCISSCPSSIRSSPSHSGVLCRPGFAGNGGARGGSGYNNGDMNMNTSTSSSMEELQSAIQGAIAHCKNSLLIQNKTMAVSSNEI